jgi:hypothetical protein
MFAPDIFATLPSSHVESGAPAFDPSAADLLSGQTLDAATDSRSARARGLWTENMSALHLWTSVPNACSKSRATTRDTPE